MLLALLILLSCAALCVSAADLLEDEAEDDEYSEEETETVKPTAAPTEAPKPSVEKLGYAAYAKKLDETTYQDTLGAIYSKKSTTFRLWSPVAQTVKVCIYKTGSDSEKGAQMLSSNSMKYNAKNGVWSLTLNGDYQNLYYTYQVTTAGQMHEVVDPYAKAVGVNGNRGMIVNLKDTDPEGWEKDSFKRAKCAADAVVWEVSVRDFSAAASSGVSEANRGKYLAFTESDTTLNGEGKYATCVAYLKELGVNYVQINPFYDFASIDEADTETAQYNWGYDPKNYNAPEGSYASDPYDGRVRIRECKAMIKALHDAGIGVIMDVVYNHTYDSEDSFFHQIAPYYYHRFNEDGTWSNGSGCGNDVATERVMVSRFICDSVAYWAQEYHIDGFRFDLMGLMDVKTLTAVRSALDKLDDGQRILMYGEAWNLATASSPDRHLATQDNMNLLPERVGAFNDTGRDAIKGSNFNVPEKGFVQSGKGKSGIRAAIEGDGGGWAKVANQCVNYASCHDNLTLYDKLTASVYGDEGYDKRREDLVAMNKLSAAIVLMSRGMPFMLAGEELGRTKGGDENSYISPVEINQIDWSNREKYGSLFDYYQGLISIRKATGTLNRQNNKTTKIAYLDTDIKTAIAYHVTDTDHPSMVVAFNGSTDEAAKVTLPEGNWVKVADGNRAGLMSLGTEKDTLSVPATSCAVLIDAESFKKIGVESSEAILYVRYHDTVTQSTVYEECLRGKVGDTFDYTTPDAILFHYNILTNTEELPDTFESEFSVMMIECEEYEGGYSSVTFRFLDEADQPISDAVVMTNRVGQQYYSPALPIVLGYSLDLQKLPDNGAGQYPDEPIEVIYRYKVSAAEQAADTEYTCRANVIYMNDDGKIMDVKSYMGVDGDMLEVDQKEIAGYTFVALSDSYAAFSPAEVNVIAFYAKRPLPVLLYVVIAAAAIVLLGGLSLIIGSKGSQANRRSKIEEMQIEE